MGYYWSRPVDPAVPDVAPEFSWVPDLPDPRDEPAHVPKCIQNPADLFCSASAVDLRRNAWNSLIPTYSQIQDKNAILSAVYAVLYAYTYQYLAREYRTGTLHLLSASRACLDHFSKRVTARPSIRQVLQALSTNGICDDATWPTTTVQVPSNAETQALTRKGIAFKRVQSITLTNLVNLLKHDQCIVFGFSVPESFKLVDDSGIVPEPVRDEPIIGGHVATIVGWRPEIQCFIVRNCWGSQWGNRGHCYISKDFIINSRYCNDFWIIRLEN